MLRILSVFFVLAISLPSFAGQIEITHTVHFDKDAHQLIPSETQALQGFVTQCNLSLEHSFQISGHTDSDGSVRYNHALSDRRAETVSSFLQSIGVDPTVVDKEVHSELVPIASNNMPEGMARNRRVIIRFVAHYFESIDEVQSLLQEGTVSQYTIDTSEERIVISQEGVRLHFPKESFVDAEGKVVEEVNLTLTESLDPLTFLAHDLQTRTRDGILESGGMIRLEAVSADGEELSLTPGRALTVSIPDVNRASGMSIFRTSDDGSSWEEDTPLITPDLGVGKAPEQRIIDLPAFVAPPFVLDQSLRPYFPVEPKYPKVPSEPARESFKKSFELKYLFNKGKRIEAEDRLYEQAIRVHDKNVKRYEKKLSNYNIRCVGYTDELNRYTEALPLWEEEIARQLLVHDNLTVPAAREEHDKEIAAIRAANKDAQFRYKEALSTWKEDYSEAMDRLGIPVGLGVDQYVFNATKLGWVNVDRFSKMDPLEKHELVASSVIEGADEKVFVMLNDGRSMIQFFNYKDALRLQGFPKTELAELVAYTVFDGQIYLYSEPFVGKNNFELDYRPSSMSELKSLLKAGGTI